MMGTSFSAGADGPILKNVYVHENGVQAQVVPEMFEKSNDEVCKLYRDKGQALKRQPPNAPSK